MDDEKGVMNGESSGTKLKVYSSVLASQLMINWACLLNNTCSGLNAEVKSPARGLICVTLFIYTASVFIFPLCKHRWTVVSDIWWTRWVFCQTKSACKKKRSLKAAALFRCIMGNVGSTVFGLWPKLDNKSQDVSNFAAQVLILFLLFLKSLTRKCNQCHSALINIIQILFLSLISYFCSNNVWTV